MDDAQRKRAEKLAKEQLAKLKKKLMQDPSLPDEARKGLEALWASHSTKGQEYRFQGRRREAIEEFRKDTEIDILGDNEAMVAETAFCLMGDTFMELGEIENAINAIAARVKMVKRNAQDCAHGNLVEHGVILALHQRLCRWHDA